MKYNSTVIAFLILLLSLTDLNAQIEINPYGGYFFKASIKQEDSKAKINEALFFGLNISYPLKYSDVQLDLTFERQGTKIYVDAINDSGKSYLDTLSVSFNYILVGGVYELYNEKSKFIPYGGVNVGLCIVNDADSKDKMYPFSFGLKGGVKYFPFKRFGFKIQSQLNLMVLTESSNFGCAVTTSGSACGLSISSIASVGQFGFSGGVIFKL